MKRVFIQGNQALYAITKAINEPVITTIPKLDVSNEKSINLNHLKKDDISQLGGNHGKL